MSREIADALARGVAFLERHQLETGELPIYASNDPALVEGASLDPSIFPNALAAWSLSFWPAAAGIRERICAFLAAEMSPGGLWRHWPRSHPHHRSLPPDLDDTSCACVALAAAGIPFPDNRALILANRDPRGLFLTWLTPRLRWSGARHMALTWRQLAHAPTLYLFFRRTSAAPRDVDAVVNANCLFHLGRFDGDEAVIAHLVAVLRDRAEQSCDKWYDNSFVVQYFLARALAGRSDEARSLLLARLHEAAPASALETALSICASLTLGMGPDPETVAALLDSQQTDGAWPRAAFYHGGRARLSGGGFAAPHPDTPRWGSEALTTAFAIEALARSREAAP